MVMAVYAPDSKKSLEMYEECISSSVTVLREGRKGGARGPHTTSKVDGLEADNRRSINIFLK